MNEGKGTIILIHTGFKQIRYLKPFHGRHVPNWRKPVSATAIRGPLPDWACKPTTTEPKNAQGKMRPWRGLITIFRNGLRTEKKADLLLFACIYGCVEYVDRRSIFPRNTRSDRNAIFSIRPSADGMPTGFLRTIRPGYTRRRCACFVDEHFRVCEAVISK